MSDSQSLNERITRVAREAGADLVGFAPISRFDNAPAEVHPRSIFPQTQTAIVVAVRQPRGPLKAVEEGCYWQSYNCDSYWYLNEIIAPKILRAILLDLEDLGYTSVPVHNPFHPHTGRKVREDQTAPDGIVSLRVMGVAAGLGELGHCKIFLTPEFGPRQRLRPLYRCCPGADAAVRWQDMRRLPGLRPRVRGRRHRHQPKRKDRYRRARVFARAFRPQGLRHGPSRRRSAIQPILERYGKRGRAEVLLPAVHARPFPPPVDLRGPRLPAGLPGSS